MSKAKPTITKAPKYTPGSAKPLFRPWLPALLFAAPPAPQSALLWSPPLNEIEALGTLGLRGSEVPEGCFGLRVCALGLSLNLRAFSRDVRIPGTVMPRETSL